MARPEVHDSTILIELARSGRGFAGLLRALRNGEAYVSAVVLTELYAGTRSREQARQLDEFVRTARQLGRILTPTEGEWLAVGRLMNRWSRTRGAIEPADHLADALIVVSAARIGGDVVSANQRHMAGWVSFARRSGLDVGLVA